MSFKIFKKNERSNLINTINLTKYVQSNNLNILKSNCINIIFKFLFYYIY